MKLYFNDTLTKSFSLLPRKKDDFEYNFQQLGSHRFRKDYIWKFHKIEVELFIVRLGLEKFHQYWHAIWLCHVTSCHATSMNETSLCKINMKSRHVLLGTRDVLIMTWRDLISRKATWCHMTCRYMRPDMIWRNLTPNLSSKNSFFSKMCVKTDEVFSLYP